MNQYVLEPTDHNGEKGSPFDAPVPEPYKVNVLGRAKDVVLGVVRDLPPKFVSRSAWGAKPAKSTSNNINPDKGGVAWHYEGPKMGTWEHDKCAGKVRQIQAFHMGSQRGWVDIAYTAVVCPHGYVFEGRGTGHRTAAQGTNDGNQRYYAVCGLMGEGDDLTADMIQGFKDATTWLRKAGKAGLSIRPHRFFHSTGCPGDLIASQAEKYDGKDFTAAPAPAPSKTHNHQMPRISKGATVSAVKDLQGHLNYAFRVHPEVAPLVCDSIWGDRMEIRFREWQKRTGLKVDGDCGDASWKRIHEVTGGHRQDEKGVAW